MKINEAPNLNYAWGMLLVEELVRNGVTYFCIAPGSRSSALTAAAAKHPKVKTKIHYDERGLAFHALGYVSVTKRPAALICSSGTAAVNFFPAVVEISKKKLPLIVLTADRPPELQQTGALQTIDQEKLYGSYVRRYINLPAPDVNIKPEVLLTTVDQAVFGASDGMAGPVHINCMFREPLAPEKTGFDASAYLNPVQKWLQSGNVYTEYKTVPPTPDFSRDGELIKILKQTERGVMVVGKLASVEEQQAVLKLSDKLNWPLFPDITSGLRTVRHPNVIHYYDQVLLSNTFLENFRIGTVLHLGGRITSKRWYEWVEKAHPDHYITVLNHPLRNDPLHRVTHRVKAKIGDFAGSLLQAVESAHEEDHLLFLQTTSESIGRIIDSIMDEWKAVNEIGTARALSRWISDGHGLFLANSMAVRELDMYAAQTGTSPVIGGNRGASGIDGIIASACGFARALEKPTTLLIGDLAFLHDLNSLIMTRELNDPLVIVVINNNGGGIFSFLPIGNSDMAADIFEPCFGTPHGLEFSKAADMFGLNYTAPGTMEHFTDAYETALQDRISTIIEVKTERKENHGMHLFVQEKIRNAVDNMLK